MPELSPLRRGGTPPAPVLNIAHRGARAFAPENTLQAFAKAKIFGCPMFEMDVHVSRDGELIVHHDDQLTRCTDVQKKFPGRDTYYVSDFTFAELRTLDAGNWYVEDIARPAAQRQSFLQTLTDQEIEQFVSAADRAEYASGEIKLPTLRETLDLALKTGMMVNIEIKTIPRMYAGLTAKVVALVESLGLQRAVLISSFDHQQLLEVRRLTDVIATGALSSDRLANPGGYLQLLEADAYNPGCYGDYDSTGFGSVTGKFDPVSIVNARSAGFGVNVWTCNDPDQMRTLIGAGVTGIITDFANRVRDVLA
ncbi:MAG: glycerophosphodiester phosphodiesterase family protein [Proteobacteria bacterium]|nr:glycerophosphodiester phosphodiesterase family protein [Pseudomonadota bacterium]